MKVILLQELKGRGGEGDVIEVADGFANNYLLPQKVAVLATKGNLKQLESRKHNIERREEKRIAEANEVKAKLESAPVAVDAKVGEEGVLFGAVTSHMIADAVNATHGTEVDRKRVELAHPIKQAGEHNVLVHLYRDIKAEVKLLVATAEKEAEKTDHDVDEQVIVEDQAAIFTENDDALKDL